MYVGALLVCVNGDVINICMCMGALFVCVNGDVINICMWGHYSYALMEMSSIYVCGGNTRMR